MICACCASDQFKSLWTVRSSVKEVTLSLDGLSNCTRNRVVTQEDISKGIKDGTSLGVLRSIMCGVLFVAGGRKPCGWG